MVLKKLSIAFAILSLLGVIGAALGLRSTVNLNSSLTSVIQRDLPAAVNLGAIGDNIKEIEGLLNYLLNPSLSLEDRRAGRARYTDTVRSLRATLQKFGDYVATGPAGPSSEALKSRWGEFTAAADNWIRQGDEIIAKCVELENSYALNPTAILRNLEKYRGDHYFLVRRLAEMAQNGRVSGAGIKPQDDLCAFGQWRVDFDNGTDLLGKNPVFQSAMDKMREPHRQFHQVASNLYHLIAEDPQGQARAITQKFAELTGTADAVVDTFAMMIGEADRYGALYGEIVALSRGPLAKLNGDVTRAVGELTAAKAAFDTADKSEVIAAGRRNIMLMWGALAGVLVLGLGLNILIRRDIKGTFKAMVGRLAADSGVLAEMADRLSQTSADLSEGATSQASALEECAAAVEEMASMTARSADSAGQANRVMRATARMVQDGEQAVEQMVAAMGSIKESSVEISRIIKAIEDIAFQTNLLALNAAVESARAGEAGAGFAVVADEVRNLAIRSAQASQDTASLIETTVQRVNLGAEIGGKIREHFESLASSSLDVSRMIEAIDVATGEQSQGMRQISAGISQIEKVTNDNVHNADDASTASSELHDRSQRLIGLVDEMGRTIGLARARFMAGRVKRSPPGASPETDGFRN